MISRTRKRLSRTNYYVVPAYVIALVGICTTCAFLVQSVRPSPSYGVVYGQLPVMHVPLDKDEKLTQQDAKYNHTINPETPVVVFRLDSFIFGNMKAFTEDFYRADNKFRIDHVDGAPHVGELLDTYLKWQNYRNPKFDQDAPQPVVLYPVGEIPMEKVIQVMDMLQKTTFFNHVVLASDIF